MAKNAWLEVHGDLWRITLPPDYSHEEFCREFDSLAERLRTSAPGVKILLDASNLQRSNAQNRERAGRFFKEERDLVQEKVKAWAFVTPSTLLRGAITAISWISKFPVQTKTHDSKASAVAWLKSK